jgi:hypothetical protein
MQCQQFLEHAGPWMEGEQHADAAAHLNACPKCRALMADLNAIRDTAGEFENEVEPPPRLWTAIRSQLEAEGVIRSAGWAERLAGLFPLQLRPALAAAYVAVLLVAATFVSFQTSDRMDRQMTSAPAAPEMAVPMGPRVTQTALASLHTHNPDVIRSYRESLQMVDNTILECEKMVRSDPQNNLAREYLTGAYQQKAELLTAIAERGTLGE